MEILEPKDLKPLFEKSFELGSEQQRILIANDSHDIFTNLERPTRGSEFGVMSYNFPKKEWTDNKNWLRYLKDFHANGVKIKVVGGPKIQSKEKLRDLIIEETIDLRLLNKPETHHIIYTSNPRQLWVEKYHSYESALNINYSKKPFEESWNLLIKLFNKVWDRGNPIGISAANSFGYEIMEDVDPNHIIVKFLSVKGKVDTQTFNCWLKRITDTLHCNQLAKEINFTPDHFSKYYSKVINESLSDLLSFESIKICRTNKLYYELTDKGKELPDYYKKTPAWETLELFSDLFR